MSVLALADAKKHLNTTAAVNDAELQGIINSAEKAIAKKCGPLEPTAKTERVKGGGLGLVLRHTPVLSLTSVTPVGGSAYDPALLDVDDSGVIEWTSGARFTPGRYDVVYSAGRTEVDDDLLLAIKELVRHMWSPQRGGMKLPGSQPSDTLSNTLPGSAYTFPIRVTELIQPHIQVGN